MIMVSCIRRTLMSGIITSAFLAPFASASGIRSIIEFDRSPETPTNELELALAALTMEELEKEVHAWSDLVVAKSAEITREQIAQLRMEGQPSAGDRAEETDTGGSAKEKSLEKVTKLNEQRTALVDRLELVLDAYESRGADGEAWRSYLAAWSGLRVDVTDTSAAYTIISGWLRSGEGGIRWATNSALFLVTLVIFWILSRITGRTISKALSFTRQPSELLRAFLVNLARRMVLLIGFVVALTAMEVPVGPFVAAIGAAGLVVGLALQGTLSNFASGILILIYKPFDVGDGVSVSGVSGSVKSMNLVSTTIHTFDNQRVIVPNNTVWGDTITNITGNPTRRVDMVFGIGYGDNCDKAKAALASIVDGHELVLKDPAPVINMNELADSSVNFIVRPWAKTADYWTVYWDVTRLVKDRFDAEGISIPFPQQDVHIYQKNPPT